MRSVRFHSFMVLHLAIALLFAASLHAELLDHHGTQADSEGTAAYCLSCHDGSAAKKVRVCTTNCTIKSHKFLVKYPPAGREKEFATQEAVLAAGIKLEDGMVTCISCHNLGNPLKYHFAVDNEKFAQKLCYACHLDIK